VFCNGACTAGSLTAAQSYNAPALVPASGGAEVGLFWLHLRLSGFVAGATTGITSTQQPNNASGGLIGVQSTGMGFTSNIVCTSNLPDKIAIAVDTQMDDGAPGAGQVRGQLQTAPNPAVGTSASAYAETGTNQYLLCKNL
jgi:hypothetical protein